MITNLLMAVTRRTTRPVRERIAGSWYSTNKTHNSTGTSPITTVPCLVGDVIIIPWSVSSESGYDFLTIYINNVAIIRESGSKTGTINYNISSAGNYTVKATYSKDGSVNSGSDNGGYSYIDRQNNQSM